MSLKKIVNIVFLSIITTCVYSQNYSWESLDNSLNNSVEALHSMNDQLYVGGLFTEAGGVTVNHVARWDGSDWNSMGGGFNDRVFNFAYYQDTLYAGGSFTQTGNGEPVHYLAKWDGQKWDSLINQLAECGTGCSFINTMTVYQNKLYVGGVLWLDLKGIGGWDGQKWDSLNGGVEPGSVNDLQIFQDTLYVGGNFDSAGSIRTPNIAKWDGQQWHPVDSFQYNVSQLTVYENQLYANSGDSIYRLESGGWNAIAGPSRLTGVRLEALDTFDNKLFVGGLFDTVDNNKVTNIGYYQNGDWHGFEPYPDFEVSAMTGYQNRLVIGGAFDSIGSLEAYRIAQLNLFVGRMAKKKTDYNVKVYPNPFQNQAKIEIPIDTIPGENPEEARVRLIFYDMIGRQVIPKYSVIRECHQLTLKIGGENLNSGLYLYQLKIREQLLKTGKIISQ